MGLANATSGQFSQAEKLRKLRLQLAETTEEQKRHIILRQIEALEQENERRT